MTDKKESAEEKKEELAAEYDASQIQVLSDSKRFASAQECTSAQLAVKDCII